MAKRQPRKKILIIGNWIPPEPSASAVRIQSFFYTFRKEFDVKLLGPGRKFENKNNVIHDPLLITVGFNLWKLLNAGQAIHRHIKSEKVDLIIASSPTIILPFFAIVSSALLHKKKILDCRDNEGPVSFTHVSFIKALLVNCMELFSLLFADMIFVTNDMQLNLLERWYRIPIRKKCIIVPNGYTRSTKSSASAVKRFDCVYLGNLDKTRDAQRLMITLQRLKKISVLIIGPTKQQLKACGMRKSDEKFISVISKVPHGKIQSYLSHCSIGIISLSDIKSLRYQMPVKVYEYMDAGLPIVCLAHSPKTFLFSFLKKMKCGKYMMSSKDFSKEINHLLKKKSEYESFSLNGKRNIKQFDRDAIGMSIMPVIQRLIYASNN